MAQPFSLLSDSIVFIAECFLRHNKIVYKPAVWQTQSRSLAFIPIKLFDSLPIIKQWDIKAHVKHTIKRSNGKKTFLRKNVNACFFHPIFTWCETAFREEFPLYNACIYEASLQKILSVLEHKSNTCPCQIPANTQTKRSSVQIYQHSQCADVLDDFNTKSTCVFLFRYGLYVLVSFQAIHSLDQKYINIL